MDLVNLMQSMSVNETESVSSSTLQLFAANINNTPTDIACKDFSNKYMLIVSQYKKLGSLLKITVDTSDESLFLSEPVYNIQTVFGSVDIEQEAAARYIAEQLGIRKTFMLFLCLKDFSVETIRELVIVLKNPPQNK